MKFRVLLSMLFDLLSSPQLTASYLSEKYDLSPRTVYRYIELLAQHLPIQIKRGRNGGVRIADTYKLPVGYMRAEEYEAAMEALSFAYAHLPEQRFLDAQRKLSAQSKTEQKDLDFNADAGEIFLDCGAFPDLNIFPKKLQILEESVRKNLLLDITYADVPNELRVEPHALLFSQGVWYLYAFGVDMRKFELFRVGKISAVWKTGSSFRKRAFSQDDFAPDTKPTDKPVTVRFQISNSALSAAQDLFGVENIRSQKGIHYGEITLPQNQNLAATFLRFGAEITVLEPSFLREEIAQTARKIAALYN